MMRESQFRALADVARAFAEVTDDVEPLLQLVVRRLAEVIGDYAWLELVSADDAWLIPAAFHHRDPDALAHLRRVFDVGPTPVASLRPLHARVLHGGEDVLVADVDPALLAPNVDPATVVALGVRSLAMVPIRARARTLGVLAVMRVGAAAEALDGSDLALVGCFASYAALALTNARLASSERAALAVADAHAESTRRSAHARSHALVEQSADAITPMTAGGVAIYQSPAVQRIPRHPDDAGEGGRSFERLHPDDLVAAEEALAEIVAVPGASHTLELRVPRENGALPRVEVSATNCLADPDVGASVSNLRDVTERVELLDRLRASEARYRRIIELTSEGIWTLDAEKRITFVNGRMVSLLGFDHAAEVVGRSVDEFLYAADRAAAAMRLVERRAGVGGQVEVRLRRRDGSGVWLLVESTPIFDADGRFEGVLAMATDVTVRRSVEARHAWLAAIVESSEDAIISKGLDGRITSWNLGAQHLYGYPRVEMLGRHARVLTRADQPDEEARLVARVSRGERVEHFETVRVRRDGSVVPVSLSLSSIKDADGRVVGVSSIARDLSAQRRAEAAQDESDRVRDLFFESSPVPIVLVDATTLAFVAVNQAAVALYGYSREEFVALRLSDLQAPAEHAVPEPGRRESGGGWRDASTHRRKDGSTLQVELVARPHRLDGRPVQIAAIQDVTDKLRLESHLRQAQKMEAVGRLAGGVAHDFNNLLSVILSHAVLALEDLPPGEAVREDVSEILRSAERAAVLTQQLLAFGRQQILAPRVVDLGTVVTGLEKMLRRVLGEDIELDVQAARGSACCCRVDAGQIEQVVMNLVINARDAMPMGGSLTIETSLIELDAAYAAAHHDVAPGAYALLAVTDSGAGMDKATQARIFEPFFTTKGVGKGTGLGLSTVFGIVKQSAGHLWVYSEPGVGTSFKVYLPRVDEDATPVPLAAPASPPTAGTETVLLVEDDEAVRNLVVAVLRRSGYRVLEAANADEARRCCAPVGAPIHLMVTDVVMPQVSGRQLAEQLTALRPEMQVLYMSGYTENSIVHHGVLDPGIAFLPKPITPAVLLRKVREVLDRGRLARGDS